MEMAAQENEQNSCPKLPSNWSLIMANYTSAKYSLIRSIVDWIHRDNTAFMKNCYPFYKGVINKCHYSIQKLNPSICSTKLKSVVFLGTHRGVFIVLITK